MNISKKERLISTVTPVVLLVSAYISLWLLLVAPVALYFFFKKYSFYFASLTALRIFDMTISMLIFAFVLGLLNSALIIVANDGEFIIPVISSGLSVIIITVVAIAYYLINLVFFCIFSALGKELNAPLSIRIFETLRGKRAINL